MWKGPLVIERKSVAAQAADTSINKYVVFLFFLSSSFSFAISMADIVLILQNLGYPQHQAPRSYRLGLLGRYHAEQRSLAVSRQRSRWYFSAVQWTGRHSSVGNNLGPDELDGEISIR